MSESQKRELESKLWGIANILRGKMNASQFQDYILGFIFYKYLSDKLVNEVNELLKPDGLTYADIDENTEEGKQDLEHLKEITVERLGFFLKPSELFGTLARRGNVTEDETKPLTDAAAILAEDTDEEYAQTFILEDLEKVLKNIERSTLGTDSQDDFDNLFYDIDLNSTKIGKSVDDRNKVIVKILTALNTIDFDLGSTDSDVLGDAYEYLIGQFAAGAGQKAGEFYTPQQVSTVLARIVTTGKKKLKSVYDPTCGSGSLLLRVAKQVDEVGHFYGQEMNRTTYNLARMNMILHDVSYLQFDIKNEDTLEHPQHLGQRFEAIVANPPFSAKWSANPLLMNDDRYSQFGKLAPKGTADFAFVQHMYYQLADNGVLATVLPHGVLFRGAAEEHIRKHFIEELNAIDAVIGLPANLFFGTSIATCILVLKKCREDNEHILFIDASKGFDKQKTQNYLLPEHIDAIVDTFQNRSSVDKYAYRATLDEVRENNYNLNIPRYVNTFEEEESIDLDAVADELVQINAELAATEASILAFCKELNIKAPF
ncbi:type I restriction-modification system subunit M [Dyadobacter tibetensis]|uniref:type I restriction-modification system subunit M n=1 Tax=Dyadobacter tibetensis TaxID=1211851 RepID=UPI00047154EE|nr:type I restriction-modification system subunit M [Dyadobacter tibetensis]